MNASITDIREHKKPIAPGEVWVVITKEGVDLAAAWSEACHEHINDGLLTGDYYKGAVVRKYRLVEDEH